MCVRVRVCFYGWVESGCMFITFTHFAWVTCSRTSTAASAIVHSLVLTEADICTLFPLWSLLQRVACACMGIWGKFQCVVFSLRGEVSILLNRNVSMIKMTLPCWCYNTGMNDNCAGNRADLSNNDKPSCFASLVHLSSLHRYHPWLSWCNVRLQFQFIEQCQLISKYEIMQRFPIWYVTLQNIPHLQSIKFYTCTCQFLVNKLALGFLCQVRDMFYDEEISYIQTYMIEAFSLKWYVHDLNRLHFLEGMPRKVKMGD